MPTRSPIGLDIGTSRIKAVQLRRCAGHPTPGIVASSPWRIAATACFDRLPPTQPSAPSTGHSSRSTHSGPGVPDEREMRRIVDVLHRRGFTGHRVVAAVPDASVLTATAELPPRSSGAPLEHLARVELARAHGRLPDELEAGCWDLPAARGVGGGGGATMVMTVGCAHDDADAVLSALDAVGLEAEMLEPRLVSSVRAASCIRKRTGRGDGGISVMIDLGHASATIIVLVSGVIIYAREVQECGAWTAVASLADRLNLSEEDAGLLFRGGGWTAKPGAGADPHTPRHDHGEAITRELDGAFDELGSRIAAEVFTAVEYAKYRYSDREVTDLCLFGGAAAIDRVGRAVETAGNGVFSSGLSSDETQREATVAVHVLHPTDGLEVEPAIATDASHPSLITAMGLAMGHMEGAC